MVMWSCLWLMMSLMNPITDTLMSLQKAGSKCVPTMHTMWCVVRLGTTMMRLLCAVNLDSPHMVELLHIHANTTDCFICSGAYAQTVAKFNISTDLDVLAHRYNCTTSNNYLQDCATEPGCLSEQTALVTCQGEMIIEMRDIRLELSSSLQWFVVKETSD